MSVNNNVTVPVGNSAITHLSEDPGKPRRSGSWHQPMLGGSMPDQAPFTWNISNTRIPPRLPDAAGSDQTGGVPSVWTTRGRTFLVRVPGSTVLIHEGHRLVRQRLAAGRRMPHAGRTSSAVCRQSPAGLVRVSL